MFEEDIEEYYEEVSVQEIGSCFWNGQLMADYLTLG
jgi:hypothetical protein